MDIDPVVLIGTAIVIITGCILGYSFSPKRGEKRIPDANGALQKYAADNGRMDVVLSKKTKLTHDTYSFTFDLPEKDQTIGLGVGHHMAIHDKIVTKDTPEGEDVMRKYTPTSTTDRKGDFELVIKIYRPNEHPKFPDGGLLTPKLENMTVGDKINISGPIGRFTYYGHGSIKIMERNSTKYKMHQVKRFGMIAGGTGITPIYQVIQAILQDPSDPTTVSLLFANKSVDDILIKDLLDKAAEDERIKVYYTLDKAPAEWKGFEGFVTKEMLQKTMPYPGKGNFICHCGPPMMCKMNNDHLKNLGYPEEQIFKF